MVDAQISTRDGGCNIARGATQDEIDGLHTGIYGAFVKIGDFTVAKDMIVSAYMLDGESVPAEPGHRYTEADLTTEG